MTTSHLTNTPILARDVPPHNPLEAAMFPHIGSNGWKRRVLTQHIDTLRDSIDYHTEQGAKAVYPTTRDRDLECVAECLYLISVLAAVARALWPPERGAALTPADLGIMAAFLDGSEPGQPLPPPLSRPEARPEES